jgi:tetratricopeptide (TPR) repeat protein
MSGTRPEREAALARLKGYLERDPENWSLRAEVFDAALAAGDRERAREQLDLALKGRPDDAGWLHRQAVLLLAQSEYAQAQSVLEALLARGLEAPAIRHNLGYALFGQGRWEAARDTVAPLLGAQDEGAASLVLWMRCQHLLDRLDEGLEAFRRLQSQRSVSADAWGVASLMALDAGQMEEARSWSDRALKEKGDQLEGLATRGTLLLAMQDAAGAAEWFEKALRVNAADGRSWSGLAFARMLGRDLRGASAAFAKALDAIPEHLGTWMGHGWCQIMAQDPGAARVTFERALEVDRNIGEVHGGLAVALARLGETALARHEIDVAMRLDPTNLSARYAEAVLSGEADDPKAFLGLARRIMAEHPVGDRILGSRPARLTPG